MCLNHLGKIPADKKSPDSLTTTTVPFVVVNVAINDLYVCRGELLDFLEQSGSKVSEISTETVYEASLTNDGCHSDEILQHSDGEERADEKIFITCLAGIEVCIVRFN